MRTLFIALVLLGTTSAWAQLRLGGDAGAGNPTGQFSDDLIKTPFSTYYPVTQDFPEIPGTRLRAPYTKAALPSLAQQPFNFAETKPYLAFFCRLELNIEEATRFPVWFRLGEVRTWQQELSKRD